ncbi:hypothetical protein ACH5RR_026569 [Cinchona calisaya]|uniref:Uncharacterized protein n=1 Tax=Cinchona calisaya TaxID=153742 RepID=A0ABD2Z2Y6_9GENT
MSLQNGLVFYITDRELKLMANTLLPSRVAEVCITHFGVFNLVNCIVHNSNNAGISIAGTGEKEFKGSGRNVDKGNVDKGQDNNEDEVNIAGDGVDQPGRS